MKKPVIAVDIDDVLAIENDAVRQFSNERYGHNHTPEDYRVPGEYWGYWQVVQGVDGEEFDRRYGEYLASGVKGQLAVMDGAIETITQLKEHFTLVIVTARDAHLVEITKEWLNAHFPDTFESVEFVAVWSGDVQASKAEICTHLKAEYLLDDSPLHIKSAHEAGITGVLFGEYGWSVGAELPQGTVRCKDWSAVGAYFERQLQA
jgi:5'(3')-deoxyribonucleotidase